jgi:membrane protease YdiL (CAAX protease family)
VLTPVLVILALGDVAIETLRIVDFMILGVGVVGVAVYHRANLRLLGPPRLDARGVPPLLLGLGVIAAVLVLLQLTMPFMFMDETEPYRLAGKSLGYMLVDFAVLPAIGEELVFRGVVLSGLLGVFQARTAALVSAMLFATVHLSPLSFLHLGILGYILARVRLGTGSLWPCMLIHGGYNAVICLLAW